MKKKKRKSISDLSSFALAKKELKQLKGGSMDEEVFAGQGNT